MKQALHIFRKDIRRLRLPLGIALLLVVAHAVFDVLRFPVDIPATARINQTASLLSSLLVMVWWYLIAGSVHEEQLPGDRQFWLTRPYSWKSLLGAKLLFVFAFFNIPLFISDCCILWAQHFPVLTSIPALLSRQLSVTPLLVLPSFALATVTTGLTQFALSWLLIALAFVTELLFNFPKSSLAVPGGGVSVDVQGGGIELTPLLAIAVGVILWQYNKRRTTIARVALAIYVCILIPLLAAIPRSKPVMFPAYSPKTEQKLNPAQISVQYDQTNPSLCKDTNPTSPSLVRIDLPLRVDNLPADAALLGVAEIHMAARGFNYPEHDSRTYSLFQRKGNHYCQSISLEANQFERIKLKPVTLSTTLYLTAVTNRPSLRVSAAARTIPVPDVGSCQMYTDLYFNQGLICQAGPYLPETTLVNIESPSFRSEPSQIGNFHPERETVEILSPVEKFVTYFYSGNPNVSPMQIRTALQQPGVQLVFTPQRPLGYGIKRLQAENLDLASYAGPRQ